MNKETILKTAQAVFSADDECFVARSPLSDVIVGHGEDEASALASFKESVEIHWEEYQAGRHGTYRKTGRPAKGKKKFAVEIDPDIQAAIAMRAKTLKISQGEMVEYLYRFHEQAPRAN